MSGNSNDQHVLVGLDGSAESIAALRWAAGYAEATGAAIRAVLAWHYPAAGGAAPVGVAPRAVREVTEQHLRGTLDQAVTDVFGTAAIPGVEARLEYGHPAQVLIDQSKDADLLVVGHRGHGAFTGMLLGSVGIHCVTSAACPVTVVRGK
jgi:nucleotide-binding universal stress UspA family protein